MSIRRFIMQSEQAISQPATRRKQMTEARRRRSTFMLFLELIKDVLIFITIELNLAKIEVKRNIRSAKKGIIQIAIGSIISLLALLTLIGAFIALLSVVLPCWLAAFVVALTLSVLGLVLILRGSSRLQNNLFILSKSLEWVKTVLKKLAEH